jgi:predicted DNA-binding transcriptional regulator AlpA
MTKKEVTQGEKEVQPESTEAAAGGRVRRMLTLEEVLEIVRVHRTTLFRMKKLGHFPASVYISENRRMWFEDEVIAWQKALPTNVRRETRRRK